MSNIRTDESCADENRNVGSAEESSFDNDFDRVMRGRYQQAVQRVSPATLARLRADRHAATLVERLPVRGWPTGAVFGGLAVGIFAIALGLNFDTRLGDDASSALQALIIQSDADGASAVAALDQDPDFYAWLASPDAQLMAME